MSAYEVWASPPMHFGAERGLHLHGALRSGREAVHLAPGVEEGGLRGVDRDPEPAGDLRVAPLFYAAQVEHQLLSLGQPAVTNEAVRGLSQFKVGQCSYSSCFFTSREVFVSGALSGPAR